MARPADGVDPRPHQRHRRRPPPREPAGRLPELRSDARHALRKTEPPRTTLHPLRCDVPAEDGRATALLTRVRRPRLVGTRPPPAPAQGPPPAVRPARPRGPRDGLVGGRAAL